MFVTRMKFAALACGLLAAGAVATAQQPGRNRPTPPARPPAAEADAAIEKEMKQLELDLLDGEVKLLREQVNAALKERVAYETSTTRVDPRAADEAQVAYKAAREVYLRRARELAIARRQLGKADEPPKADKKPTAAAPPAAGPKQAGDGPKGAGGARVGSIDMDAVVESVERSEGSRRTRQRLEAERQALAESLNRFKAQIGEITAQMDRSQPGSESRQARERRLADLKERYAREYEDLEKKVMRHEARDSAVAFKGIREAVAAIAEARGLDYVVTIDRAPEPDAGLNELNAAFKHPVLYANPRHDITEEVIRELNRRDQATNPKAPQ